MNDRKLMRFTNRIAELGQILAAAFHIPILVLAVQRRCTNHNMIVHMLLIDVSRNDVPFPCAGLRQLPLCGLAARNYLALQVVSI